MATMAQQPFVERAQNHRKKATVHFTLTGAATVGAVTAAIDSWQGAGQAVEIAITTTAGTGKTATGSLTSFAYTGLQTDTANVAIGIGVVDPGAVRPISAFGCVKVGAANMPLAGTIIVCADPTASSSGVVAPTYTTVGSGGVAFLLTLLSSNDLVDGTNSAINCQVTLEWE